MKKIIFLLGISFLSILTKAESDFIVRPSLGLNWASLTNESNLKSNARIGFQFGGDVQIGYKIYFQPGFFLTNSNMAIKSGNSFSQDLSYTGFRIPVLFGFKMFDSQFERDVNVRFFTGSSAILITSLKSNASFINKDEFQKGLFGWNAGIGFDLKNFFIDGGYEFGLNDALRIADVNYKNNALYINLGFRLKL